MPTMTRSGAVRIAIVSIATMVLLSLIPAGASAGSGVYRDRWLMKRETNESRLAHGVRRLGLDEEMSELARRHSVKMARKGDLFHTADPAGYYLKGVKWRTWGENVGKTGGSIAELQRAFMRSYYHRLNVLNDRFRRVAIGAVRREGALWVTVFFYG